MGFLFYPVSGISNLGSSPAHYFSAGNIVLYLIATACNVVSPEGNPEFFQLLYKKKSSSTAAGSKESYMQALVSSSSACVGVLVSSHYPNTLTLGRVETLKVWDCYWKVCVMYATTDLFRVSSCCSTSECWDRLQHPPSIWFLKEDGDCFWHPFFLMSLSLMCLLYIFMYHWHFTSVTFPTPLNQASQHVTIY